MATSGTATFTMDLTEIVEEAYERAGSELKSGYDFRKARRSLNLLFVDWANRGLNMWTFEQGTQVLTAGTASYTLPADTVDLIEHAVRTGSGTSQLDIPLTRMSVSTYATTTNKVQTGRPLKIMITRGVDAPTAVLWPVPDATTTYTMVYWRLRRIQDATSGVQTTDVPFRFLPCLVAGLAYYLAMKDPALVERLPMLKMAYDEAWVQAHDEDRERASVFLVPKVG